MTQPMPLPQGDNTDQSSAPDAPLGDVVWADALFGADVRDEDALQAAALPTPEEYAEVMARYRDANALPLPDDPIALPPSEAPAVDVALVDHAARELEAAVKAVAREAA